MAGCAPSDEPAATQPQCLRFLDPNGTLGAGDRIIANLRTTGSGELVVNGTAIETDTEIGSYSFVDGHTGSRDLGTSGIKINIDGLSLTQGDKFTLSRSGNNLVLNFSPVPEPASMLAVCGLVVGGFVAVRKLRRKGKPADVTPAA